MFKISLSRVELRITPSKPLLVIHESLLDLLNSYPLHMYMYAYMYVHHHQFDSNFVPNRWGGGYTEGSAWHHSFPSYAVKVEIFDGYTTYI
jgi:hypothetical protein